MTIDFKHYSNIMTQIYILCLRRFRQMNMTKYVQ